MKTRKKKKPKLYPEKCPACRIQPTPLIDLLRAREEALREVLDAARRLTEETRHGK